MTQKRSYKVLAAIPKHDGSGEWFMKVGSGFTNRDESINLYLDAIPMGQPGKGIRLQIRELDANDLARRDAYRANSTSPASATPSGPPTSANESIPF